MLPRTMKALSSNAICGGSASGSSAPAACPAASSSARSASQRRLNAMAAMVGGTAQAGRVIFAAGAVMVAVFFTLALSGPLPPKEMGVILGVAVLLDAFVVRLLLVPVLLRLAGPVAWYRPRWLARILPDVRFGHGDAPPARSPA